MVLQGEFTEMSRFVVSLETECCTIYFPQFGKTVIVMIISLAITYHPEQVDTGIPLLIDNGSVEGGYVVETFPVDGGKGMPYLEKVVQGFSRDDVDCSGYGV